MVKWTTFANERSLLGAQPVSDLLAQQEWNEPSTMVKWTTFANERSLLGAQPVSDLLAQQEWNEPVIRRWLDQFIDRWLGLRTPPLLGAD